MPIAPGKTRAILFTPAHSNAADESNGGLQINVVHIPLTKAFDPECRLLGVHLDAQLSFARHLALTRFSALLHFWLLRHARWGRRR